MKPIKQMPLFEFVAFMALMFATVAYSTDSMLPLIVQIGEDLAPQTPQSAQLVITSFVFWLRPRHLDHGSDLGCNRT